MPATTSPIDLAHETYFIENPYGSVVRCDGEDTKSFLHRMSTQDINSLSDGEGTLNAYVNQKGRLIDLTYHLQFDNNTALLLGQHATGTSFIEWLDQFHFIEKIQFTDLSAASAGALLFGSHASGIIEKLISAPVTLAPWQFIQKGTLLVVRIFDYHMPNTPQTPCFYVCNISGTALELHAQLKNLGALELEKSAEESLRVFSGIPRVPNEINDALTPLALALHDSISWSKGCYIGQEVIARMDTYDRITKNLSLFTFEASAPVPVGTHVLSGEKVVGEVTSVSQPQHGPQQGLAMIKLKESELKAGTFHIRLEEESFPAVLLHRPAAQQPHD